MVNHLDMRGSAEGVVDEIVRSGAEAVAVAGDASSRRQFEAVVAATIDRFRR